MRNSKVRIVSTATTSPWDDLNDDEKHMFSRMAEVFAGFSEYTDAQVGRIVPVSSAYPEPRFEFRGGEIAKVVFDIADDAYIDVEKHMQAAMARD
ncbi:hypothetical protein [Prescottella equi]|uniref:hypothetical protein n=1 Tax=Rhodococcus hoagii TaxID=43767 RepID=UPI001C785A16|nr:hypothetical protein [Prescottella equi]BCN76787.1 hypothetical protein RE0346_04470 [Prescottella equi]